MVAFPEIIERAAVPMLVLKQPVPLETVPVFVVLSKKNVTLGVLVLNQSNFNTPMLPGKLSLPDKRPIAGLEKLQFKAEAASVRNMGLL
jgi:hypothetical protein